MGILSENSGYGGWVYGDTDSEFAPKGAERKVLTFKLMQAQDPTHRFTVTAGQGYRLHSRDWTPTAGLVQEVQLVLGQDFGFPTPGARGNLSGTATASANCYVTLYGHRKTT